MDPCCGSRRGSEPRRRRSVRRRCRSAVDLPTSEDQSRPSVDPLANVIDLSWIRPPPWIREATAVGPSLGGRRSRGSAHRRGSERPPPPGPRLVDAAAVDPPAIMDQRGHHRRAFAWLPRPWIQPPSWREEGLSASSGGVGRGRR